MYHSTTDSAEWIMEIDHRYSSYFTSLLTKINLLDLQQNSHNFSNLKFEMLACDVAAQPHSNDSNVIPKRLYSLTSSSSQVGIRFNPFNVNNDTICVQMFEPFEFNVIKKGKNKVEYRCCCCPCGPNVKCPPKAQHVQVCHLNMWLSTYISKMFKVQFIPIAHGEDSYPYLCTLGPCSAY